MKRNMTEKSTKEGLYIAKKASSNMEQDVEKNAHTDRQIETEVPDGNAGVEEESEHNIGIKDKMKGTENVCENCDKIEEGGDENNKEEDDINVEEEVKNQDGVMLSKENKRNVKLKKLGKRSKAKHDDGRSLKGLGRGDSEHCSSMEALGMFGLLTPAMAAVPASDEFDTMHKQVREHLGKGWEIQLAAAHVDDALTGRGKHGKARSYFKKKSARRCFQILDNFWYQRFFLLVILLHSLTIFFEPPSSPVPNVHILVFVANGLCIVVFILDLMLRFCFLSWPIFWSKETAERYWNGVQFVLVFLFWVDFIILCLSTAIKQYIPQPFRFLRLVVLLCRLKSIRHIFEVLMIISHNLLKVLFIILIFIITFASIGVHLYMPTYNRTYTSSGNSTGRKCCIPTDDDEAIYIGTFDHIGTAMLRLFVLLSTENYPEIMLPALREQKFNFFFFGVFVFFGGFFVTAILLAIVVDTYWIFAKKTVKKERARERTELAKAWNLLDPLGLGALAVTDKQFLELFRILKPKNTDEQNLMLVELLDSQNDGDVDSFEWTTTLRQALNAEFEEEVPYHDKDESSKILARIRKQAKSVTESVIFSRAMLCLILLHCFLFCLKWKGQSYECEQVIHAIRSVIIITFMFEITIRFVGLGKRMTYVLEMTDVVLVFISVVFNLLWYIDKAPSSLKEICIIISSLAVVARWLLNSSGTRKAFRWFLDIVPVMFDLVALLFVILYLLSTIAMELFHSHNKSLTNLIYPDNCGLGFVNFWCSFLVMFQTLTTSNWHEIMNLRFFLLVILLHSLTIFFEPPSSPVPNVHILVFVANGLCIVVFILDLMLRFCFLSWPIFWSKETAERYWNGVQFVLVFLFWVDFIILCLSTAIKQYIPQPFRFLRLVVLLCRLKSIRHIFEVLMIISHNLLKVLFIILIFIITFASIGVHLYMPTYNRTYTSSGNSTGRKCCIPTDDDEAIYIGTFDHIGTAMLRLFVLLSTENYPEIMLPALREQKFNFFFFGVFVFFGGFFVTAILLAIVVDTYWIFAKKTVKKERARERTELAKAWNLLDPLGLGALAVTDKQFLELFRILKPKNTDEQNLMLVELLDSQNDGDVDSFEWTTTLRQALNAEFEEEVPYHDKDESSKILARIRKQAKSVTESVIFSRAMLCLILLHCFLFCLKWKGQSYECEQVIHAIRSVIIITFMFEITIRFVGLGKRMTYVLEMTDVVLVFISVVFNLLWYIDKAPSSLKEICIIISSLAVVARWLLNSSGTRKAFRWFLDIVPVMFDLVALLFVILYLLSTIAMELFHSHNKSLTNLIYPDNCGLGFVNFWCSFLVMFQTLTTSNWHEIMNLVQGETKNRVAYVFFPLSYLITTMIVMNLFVAIAIEAANKLTDKDPTSLKHRTTEQEMQKQPKSFNECARKVLATMVKNVFDSSRVDDRNKRQQIGSPNSSNITVTNTGTRKGSSTIILSSPRREANVVQKDIENDKKNDVDEEEDSDDIEDYTGLSAKEKREKQLKNRMKKKRKARHKKRKSSTNVLDQIQKQVRAIASFRGSQATDLDLVVGDTITVVATRDEWIQGECKGVTGWFPASHVVNWTVKARPSSGKRERRSRKTSATAEDVSPTYETLAQPLTNKPSTSAEAALEPKNTSNGSHALLSPHSNYRIKIKKSGDWRREILGDMTVMNAEEMRELNKVMRAELRGPRGRGSKGSIGFSRPPSSAGLTRRDFAPTIEEWQPPGTPETQARENSFDSIRKMRTSTNTSSDVFLPDSPQSRQRLKTQDSCVAPLQVTAMVNSRPTTPKQKATNSEDRPRSVLGRFPVASVGQMSNFVFASTSDHAEDVEKQESCSELKDKDFLAIADGDRKSSPKKKTNPSGEIPDWAKKFVEDKNIDVHSDVKFSDLPYDEGALPGSVQTLQNEDENPPQSC